MRKELGKNLWPGGLHFFFSLSGSGCLMGAGETETGGRRWWVLGSICLGTFISVTNGSIVNVALPNIAAVFGVELPVVQWVVLAFLLTIASTLPVVGRIADMVGRKKIYAGGFLILMAGSLLCGLANSIEMLVASRVLQAVGAAMPMANGMAITTSTFPAHERGRALGIVGSIVAIGALVGPTLGGFLVSAWGWPWIFFVNLPLGMVAFVTASILLPNDKPAGAGEKFDYLGAVLFTAAMLALLLAVSGIGSGGGRYGLWAIAAAGGASFIWVETRQPYPVVDLSLFRQRLFSVSLGAAFLAFLSMSANVFLMPFFLQDLLGYESYQAGLLMIPYPLVMAVVAPLSGWLSDITGPVWLTTGGLALNIVGLLSLGYLGADATFLDVALRLGLLGLGMGMFQSPNNSTVMGAVPRNKLGTAGGVNALVRNVAMVLGTAVIASLFYDTMQSYLAGAGQAGAAVHQAAFLAGWRRVFTLAALLAAVAAFLSAIRGSSEQGKPQVVGHEVRARGETK